MEVRFKLSLTVLSYDDPGKKITYKDVFRSLSESYDRMISAVSVWHVKPDDDISIEFNVNKK